MAKRTRIVRGFTLIELVIVIAVIAILAALLAPTILGQVERARASRARSDVKELAGYIARMRVDTGTTNQSCLTDSNILRATSLALTAPYSNAAYCTPKAITNCNFNAPDGMSCWGGPYTAAPAFTDPWNSAYAVSLDTNTLAVTVRSYGPDQTIGTSDDLTAVQ